MSEGPGASEQLVVYERSCRGKLNDLAKLMDEMQKHGITIGFDIKYNEAAKQFLVERFDMTVRFSPPPNSVR